MRSYEGAVEGRKALDDFLDGRSEAIPDDIRNRLHAFKQEPSPVFACANAAELVYAKRDECGPELRDLAAGLAVMCEAHGLFGLADESRGSRMALALRGQDVADPPAPKAEFAPPPPEPPPVMA